MSFSDEYLNVCNKYPKEILEREQKIRDDASNHNRYASKEAKDKINNMQNEIQALGNKLGDKLTSLEIQVARIPEKLSDKFDNRYADKALETMVNKNCDEINSFKDELNRRTYDWLKYAITTAVLIGLTFIFKRVL